MTRRTTQREKHAAISGLCFALEIVLAAVAAVCLSAPITLAQPLPTFYVTSANNNGILQFTVGATGDLSPLATIVGAQTGLVSPSAIAVDSGGTIYVANFAGGSFGTGSVTIYPAASVGNASPSATISGVDTQLAGPEGVAVDAQGNIYVASVGNVVTEYAPGSNGDAEPIAAILGTSTQLAAPGGVALDAKGNIYVANLIGGTSSFGSVTIYAPGSTGNSAPTSSIEGANTGLAGPQAIAIDAAGNIYVANLVGGGAGTGSFTIYTSGSNGNVAPAATIAGSSTGLLSPQGIAVDGSGNIYVANTANSITEYAAGADGNVAPAAIVSGISTTLDAPRGVALKPAAAGPTPTPTPTPTPAQTVTPAPTPTPAIFACSGSTVGQIVPASELAGAAKGRPPRIGSVAFSRQAQGAPSAPLTAKLINTTLKPLTVSNVTVSGDFSENNGCIGALAAGASCDISIVFTPKRAGKRTGMLTIKTSGGTLHAGVSGIGVAPKCVAVTPKSQAALAQVTFTCSGLAPGAPVVVTFAEKLLSRKKGPSLPVAASLNDGKSITVTVPPVVDPSSGEPVAGSASVSARELLTSGTLTAKSPALKIGQPSGNSSLSPDTVVADFLQEEQSFAMKLGTDVQGTALASAALETALGQVAGDAGSLLKALTSASAGTQLGSVGGTNVTVGQLALTMADNELLSSLQALASGGGSGSTIGAEAQTAGSGCLAVEAAAALSDASSGNAAAAAAFASDIANLFQDSETSPACQQPQAAILAAGIVNGAAAATLSILTQAKSPKVSNSVPSTALAYAGLGAAGQLISVGVTLAQTSTQAQQAVVNAVKSFDEATGNQLNVVVSQTQGASLQGSYGSTNQTGQSFSQTVQTFDGNYSGTFTGTQYFSDGSSCPVTSSIGFSISGSTLTASMPGSGGGTLSGSNGSLTITGLGGSSASCTFAGSFAVDTTGAASASGTWTCTSGPGSGATSANGTWTANRT